MGGIKPAEVICRFTQDGNIMPLQFVVDDEEGVRRTFRIKAYKPTSVCLGQHRSFIGQAYQTRDMMDYECKIEVCGYEKIVKLRYFVDRMLWNVVY